MNKQNFYLKKVLFLRKCLWTRGLQLWRPGKKYSFRLSVFWIRVRKKCERLYIIQKLYFPKNFHGYIDCGFRNSGEFFAGSKHSLRIGKNSELFSFEKKFHKLFPRTAIAVLPNLKKNFSPLSRKLQKISESPRVFKTSIRKCWSVSVPLDKSKVFLTTLPKTFLQKHRFFLSKTKKDEKPIVQQFFWRYSSVHLDYCFNTPDYFFC